LDSPFPPTPTKATLSFSLSDFPRSHAGAVSKVTPAVAQDSRKRRRGKRGGPKEECFVGMLHSLNSPPPRGKQNFCVRQQFKFGRDAASS
jgi:hypothetical protein